MEIARANASIDVKCLQEGVAKTNLNCTEPCKGRVCIYMNHWIATKARAPKLSKKSPTTLALEGLEARFNKKARITSQYCCKGGIVLRRCYVVLKRHCKEEPKKRLVTSTKEGTLLHPYWDL